jgi:AraC-like DNA-binding protein/quercetin dioxygenase-like cupin family protein
MGGLLYHKARKKRARRKMNDNIEKSGKLNYHYEHLFNPPRPYENLDLLQIGTSYCQPRTTVGLHSHVGFFEISAILSGKGTVWTNNVAVPVSQGDIFISFPYDTHSLSSDEQEGMNYSFCAFFLKDAELLFEMEKLSLIYAKPTDRIIRSERVNALLAAAIAETGKERLLQKKYLESLFAQMIIQIVRAFNRQSPPAVAPSKREELCFQVMDYINTHIYTIDSLEEIAKQFSYDYTYISKIFTKTTSQSISEYYRFQRLEVARALIHEDRLKISEIAERLRYSSIYSFSKAFKKQYGVSPREYKKGRA